MYIAKQNEDGSFNIYSPQTIQDLDGNDVQTLGEPVAVLTQDMLDDRQTMLDAINACQGGDDVKTQVETFKKLNIINLK